MKISFRQGLVLSEVNSNGQPNYLTLDVGSGITLRTSNRSTTFSVADGAKNYTIEFYQDVLAWPSAMFTGVNQAWLFIDLHRTTSARTYGITTSAPTYGPVAPANPVDGQHWFDTTKTVMKVYAASTKLWIVAIRVLAGQYTNGSVTPVAFGSQVGISTSAVTGSIFVDGFGVAVKDSKGNFLTTEDVVTVSGAPSYAAKLESNVSIAEANEPIPAFHVVKYDGDNKVSLASYVDVGNSAIGIATADADSNEVTNIVLQGQVQNPEWNWAGPSITLWVSSAGELVSTDPFITSGSAQGRQPPVARTLNSTTIIFNPGLVNMIGERGPSGSQGIQGEPGPVGNAEIASVIEKGIVKLSVDPVDGSNPIAVGINDPIVLGPRPALPHTHSADQITVVPFGGVTGPTVQQALVTLDSDTSDLEDRIDSFSNANSSTAGAGAIGYNDALSYPTNTVGNKLKTLSSSAQTSAAIQAAITLHNEAANAHPALSALVTAEADRAEAAADAASLSAGVFATTTAGLAATTTGKYFSVPSADSKEHLILYLNNDGVATEIKRYPSSAAVQDVLSFIRSADGTPIYFFIDDLGFAWGSINSDGFDLPGLATLKTQVTDTTTMQDADGFMIFEDGPNRSSFGPLSMCEVPGATFYVTDELGFVWVDLLNVGQGGGSVTPEPVPSTIPIISGTICGVQNVPTSLYVRNILPKRSDTNLIRGTITSRTKPEMLTSSDELRFFTEAMGPQAYLYLRSEQTTALRTRLILNCATAPNPGTGSGGILTLGDSISNRQGGMLHKQYLNEWGYTPSFIGTLNGSTQHDNSEDANGELGEAREGWETGDFTYSVTNRVSIVPPGGEAAYLASPKMTKWPINPFLRAATVTDSGTIVRNGMVFDPAFYQTRFGLATPKVVNIALGTNNVRDQTETSIYDNMYSDLTLIVTQCRAAWPSAKIVLSCPGAPRDPIRDQMWETKYVPMLRAMLQVRNDINHANVIVFPVWAHVTQEAGYTITSPSTDPLTGAVTGGWGDAIHPRESTRMQLHQAYAKMLACALANLI